MAIRRMTAADVPTLITWWNAHKAANTEYAGDLSVTSPALLTMIADTANVVLVDPATQTLALGTQIGTTGHLMLMITRTAAALAARTAVDHMFEAVCTGAIARGVTLLYGDYTFPAGVNVENTAAIRYFNTLTPPLVKTVTPQPNGTLVRFAAPDIPALMAALTARTP